MRKSILILFLGFFGTVFANSVEDARLLFSTKGPDRYADGSVVLDGECYALVWSKDGNFDGFDANGACIDSNDKIVLVAPVAKGGRCPPVLFQIPAAEVDALAGGQYAVYLLDTRILADGEVKAVGVSSGQLALMNGYGEASAAISVKSLSNTTAKESDAADGGLVAAKGVCAPAGCAQPRIKAIRIEGENVFLTVENLGGFLRVRSGSDVSVSGATGAAVEASGDEDVTIVTRKPGNSGFFKVIRNGK